MNNEKIKLGIIIGGKSVEHEISVISGLQAYYNIDKEKYDTTIFYMDKSNHIYASKELKNIETYKTNYTNKEKEVFFKKINNQIYYQYLNRPKKSYPIDIFMPVLHGYGTEDGTVSGFLDIYQAIYTCSDLIPSAIIQDKIATKAMLKFKNFPVIDGFVAIEKEEIEKCDFPAIVKPAYLGSSIGIKVVKNQEELEQALNNAYKYTNKVLIEKAIVNFKEYNCAVIKDHGIEVTSSIEEVKHEEEILSFSQKYEKSEGKMSGLPNRIIPALINETLKDDILKMSKELYRLFDLKGVVRIDYIYDLDENKLYVNEINNIPGSLAFYLFEKEGLNFTKMIDILIANAIIEKHNKDKKITSFESNVFNNKSSKLKNLNCN